jgi:hypothetical protein
MLDFGNVESKDLHSKMDSQFQELISTLLAALGPKDLKEFLTANDKDFDDKDFKGPQLAHHAADLLYFGRQLSSCPVISPPPSTLNSRQHSHATTLFKGLLEKSGGGLSILEHRILRWKCRGVWPLLLQVACEGFETWTGLLN